MKQGCVPCVPTNCDEQQLATLHESLSFNILMQITRNKKSSPKGIKKLTTACNIKIKDVCEWTSETKSIMRTKKAANYNENSIFSDWTYIRIFSLMCSCWCQLIKILRKLCGHISTFRKKILSKAFSYPLSLNWLRGCSSGK